VVTSMFCFCYSIAAAAIWASSNRIAGRGRRKKAAGIAFTAYPAEGEKKSRGKARRNI
jgi:hypothetical protein